MKSVGRGLGVCFKQDILQAATGLEELQHWNVAMSNVAISTAGHHFPLLFCHHPCSKFCCSEQRQTAEAQAWEQCARFALPPQSQQIMQQWRRWP